MKLDDLKWEDRYSYKKVILYDEDDLGCKGSKVQLVKFLPDTSIKPHYHKKTHEVFTILEGEGILRLNDVEFRCSPFDSYLCRPGDLHEFVNDTEDDFIIHIDKTNEAIGDMYWGEPYNTEEIKGNLTKTHEDHNKSVTGILADNPGKCLAELYSDEELLENLHREKKALEELKTLSISHEGARLILPNRYENTIYDYKYLDSIGRLPEEFKKDLVEYQRLRRMID